MSPGRDRREARILEYPVRPPELPRPVRPHRAPPDAQAGLPLHLRLGEAAGRLRRRPLHPVPPQRGGLREDPLLRPELRERRGPRARRLRGLPRAARRPARPDRRPQRLRLDALPPRAVRLPDHQLLRVLLSAQGQRHGLPPGVPGRRARPPPGPLPQRDDPARPAELRRGLQPDPLAARHVPGHVRRQGRGDLRRRRDRRLAPPGGAPPPVRRRRGPRVDADRDLRLARLRVDARLRHLHEGRRAHRPGDARRDLRRGGDRPRRLRRRPQAHRGEELPRARPEAGRLRPLPVRLPRPGPPARAGEAALAQRPAHLPHRPVRPVVVAVQRPGVRLHGRRLGHGPGGGGDPPRGERPAGRLLRRGGPGRPLAPRAPRPGGAPPPGEGGHGADPRGIRPLGHPAAPARPLPARRPSAGARRRADGRPAEGRPPSRASSRGPGAAARGAPPRADTTIPMRVGSRTDADGSEIDA